MPHADPKRRPTQHACCPNARQLLRTRSAAGRWGWVLLLERVSVPMRFCPWCGEKLPSERAAGLALVPGGGNA